MSDNRIFWWYKKTQCQIEVESWVKVDGSRGLNYGVKLDDIKLDGLKIKKLPVLRAPTGTIFRHQSGWSFGSNGRLRSLGRPL